MIINSAVEASLVKSVPSDWRKDLKELYFPPRGKVVEVVVPELKFLVVEGEGNPNESKGFQEAVGALYTMSFTLKFAIKKKDPSKDYKVGPLEALWWNTKEGGMEMGRKEDWGWKSMIMQPSFMEGWMVEQAREEAVKKKDNPGLKKVGLEVFEEGRCAQIMHIGRWDEEEEDIERVKSYIKVKGGTLNGKHHEIYMSDPRRVPPEKWKTVIRQPFRRISQ